ncbi:MAG: SAM-dependent methyltransferase, partial [Pseudomonadota bacterium]
MPLDEAAYHASGPAAPPRGTPPPFMVGFTLAGRVVVLAGEGDAPRAKAEMLLAAGATLRLLNAEPGPWMQDRIAEGRAHLHPAFDDALFDGVALAMAVDIEDPTPEAFAAAARARGLLVNVADNPPCCDFNTPAYFDRGPIRVALGSGGTAPMLVSLLRQGIEQAIDPTVGVIAAAAARLRGAVAAAFDKPDDKGRRFAFWEDFFEGRIESPGDCPAAAEFAALRAIADRAGGTEKRQGRVDLIGAGPGDPELLTFKAARAIARADLVLYDALVDDRVVALARRDAELLDVGKRAGGRSTPQREICALIAEHAAAGKRVAR